MRKVEMNKKEGNELVKDGASWSWGGLNVTYTSERSGSARVCGGFAQLSQRSVSN
jgi:hypothetical protein